MQVGKDFAKDLFGQAGSRNQTHPEPCRPCKGSLFRETAIDWIHSQDLSPFAIYFPAVAAVEDFQDRVSGVLQPNHCVCQAEDIRQPESVMVLLVKRDEFLCVVFRLARLKRFDREHPTRTQPAEPSGNVFSVARVRFRSLLQRRNIRPVSQETYQKRSSADRCSGTAVPSCNPMGRLLRLEPCCSAIDGSRP